MYSVRPNTEECIQFDLPTTMYSVQAAIKPIESSIDGKTLKDAEHRQDALLEKIENLFNQLALYQKIQEKNKQLSVPVRRELVVHLSAKNPSKDIMNFIKTSHDQFSLRTFRHSSMCGQTFKDPLESLSLSSNDQAKSHSLAIVWVDDGDLPYMFHSNAKINDEQSIIKLLSQQLRSQ